MSDAVDHGSISSELEGIDLGDKRLNKRCMRLIEALAVDPQLSINASCNGWNETHAAYELLDYSSNKQLRSRICRFCERTLRACPTSSAMSVGRWSCQ